MKMEFYSYEKIEVPLIYAQKVEITKYINSTPQYEDVGNPVGPFPSGQGASILLLNKEYTGVYGIINRNKALNGYRFFTKNSQTVTFKNLNIREIKQKSPLYQTRHLNEVLLQRNLEICGYENVQLIKFNASKSLMEVKCHNVDCDEKIQLKYNHLTMPAYKGSKCDNCKSIYQSFIRLGKTYQKQERKMKLIISKHV